MTKFNLKEIEKERKNNFLERLRFIKYWVEYIKNHSDKEWSSQQKILINSQIKE